MARAHGAAMKAVEENAEAKATTTMEKGEGPSRFRKYTSLSAMKAGDGSFRGLLGLSKTTAYNGPSMREVGPQYYLREEIRAARDAVTTLDRAVSGAQSFREKATKLLEEAHRAMGRLEQAVAYRDAAPELIVIACEIKCAARRGITLVDVYGKYSTMVKVMTLFMRSYIHSKFDKQIDHLKSLIPPAEVMRGAAAAAAAALGAGGSNPGGGGGMSAATPSRGTSAPQAMLPSGAAGAGVGGGLAGPLSPLASLASSGAASAGVASSLASAATTNGPSLTPPPASVLSQQQASLAQSLARSSLGHPAGVVPPPGSTSAPPAPLVGTMLRPNKHDRVHALAYVPPGQASSGEYVCIWWSAGQMLEFYSEATQSTTGFQIEKASLNVTALGIDEDGNVWTGHGKGLVRVRPKQMWEFMVEDKAFSSAVKAITFDEKGRAWIGDDSGRIKVLGYDPRSGRLETVASLQRSPALLAKMKGALADTTRGLFGKRHCPSSGAGGQASAAAVFAAASAAAATAAAAAAAAATEAQNLAAAATAAITGGTTREASPGAPAGGHNPPVAIEGPVRCIFLRGGRAWTSGGRSSGWLQLWDANSFQDLDVYDCCGFGPCHAMASVRWPTPTASAPSSYHPSTHRRTPSDQPTPGVFDAATAAAAAGTSAVPAAPSSAWRLLTGHENGQLLLWHPDHKGLAPLLRIGEPGSPCRGIAAFDGFRLVATGHQNGELHLFLQPSAEAGLPPGSESVAPQSFGTLRPRMVTIQAHKSRVDRMVCSGTSCATASQLGTIRLWHATDLAMEAHRQGLLTHTASYGSLLLAGGNNNNGGGLGGGATMSGAPSLQTFGTRQSASTSIGDLSPSQYHRDSTKRLAQGPLDPSGGTGLAVGSPPNASMAAARAQPYDSPNTGSMAPQQHQQQLHQQYGGGGASTLAGASTISTNLSVVLSHGSQGSAGLQQAGPQAQGGAPGSASYHHARQGSKDSSDTAGGSITQPSSSGTQLVEGAGGSTASQQTLAPTGPSAVFPHFQTIEASELSLKKLIGSGAYGKVWLAEWTGCQVAVKELFGLQGGLGSANEKEFSALMNEVTLLGSLSHPNIMRFLAMCLDPPLIVMQYYPHGSLFDLLARAQKGSAKAAKELTWGKRLDMLRDVAAGMQYLHSRKPPVIHGDLRSPNLLLDLTIDHERPRFHVKIADFGLARMATGATGSVMVSKTTNPRWLAPEVIKNSSVGKAADVYSFAIIMWEMLTWQQPYEDMMSVQVMFSTVTENNRPDVPPESQLPGGPGVSLQLYRQLMESCWHADAAQRPSFKEVVEYFQGMQRVEAEAAKQQAATRQAGRRSRGPSETGFTAVAAAPGSGGSTAATPEGAAAGAGPNSAGSTANGGVGPAAAAVAATTAAARRAAAGPAVASPFQGASSPFQGSSSPFQGASSPFYGASSPFQGSSSPFQGGSAPSTPFQAAPPDASAGASGASTAPHPPYGGGSALLSPILEEQMSSMTATASAAAGDSHTVSPATGASAGGAAGTSSGGGAAPADARHTHAPAHAHTGPGQQAQRHSPPAPQQHPHAHSHLHPNPHPQQQPHPHPHQQQQHVQFAPSAFAAAAAAGADAEDSSNPSSPHAGTRSRGAPADASAPRTHPPSSASSSEGALVVNVHSAGSNTGGTGAPSPACSSRHSSTSTSGRTIGPAAAAAVTAASAGASGAHAGSHGTGARRAAAGPAAAGRQAAGAGASSTAAARRDGAGGAGAAHTPAGKSASSRRPAGASSLAPGAIAAAQEADAQLWESSSAPVGGMTALSPFASLPPSQLGELDSAAPRESLAAAHLPGQHPHSQHTQQQHPQHPHPGQVGSIHGAAHGDLGAGRHHPSTCTSGATAARGPTAAGAGAGTGATARGSRAGSASNATPTGLTARNRIPGPSFGPGPGTVRSTHGASVGPGTGHGTAARGTGATAHSQPGTPPYRGGTPASPFSARGAGGPSAGAAYVGSRTGSITGYSAGNSAVHGAVQRIGSGDGPVPPAGSRTASITGAPPDVASSATPISPSEAAGYGGSAAHRAGGGGGGGQRQSFSAAHAHLDLGEGEVGVHEDSPGHRVGAGRPTHRRTPSGGTVPSTSHAYAGVGGPGAPTGRARDLAGTPGTAAAHPHAHLQPHSHHLREVGSPAAVAAAAGGSGASGALSQPRTPTGAIRGARASPRVSAASGSGADSARGTPASRRQTPGGGGTPTAGAAASTTTASGGTPGSSGLSGLGSPSAQSSGHLARRGVGAASTNGRPPASPRSYVPGGPGSISAHATTSTTATSAIGSRIPSLSHGHPGGAHGAPPAKTGTSRSLDDLGVHREQELELEPSLPAGAGAADAGRPLSHTDGGCGYDAAGAAAAGAVPQVAVAAAACSPFAVAAGGGWDDGLGVRHSPDPSQEVVRVVEGDPSYAVDQDPDPQSGSYPSMPPGEGGEEEEGIPEGVTVARASAAPSAAESGRLSQPQLPLPRIATTVRSEEPGHGSGGHQPAPRVAAWQPPALRTAAAGGSPFAAAAAYSSPFMAASQAEGEGVDEREGRADDAVHQPQQQQQQQQQPTGGGVVAARGPFAQVAAQSPFAQHAGDQDSWWDEQHQHYDN